MELNVEHSAKNRYNFIENFFYLEGSSILFKEYVTITSEEKI